MPKIDTVLPISLTAWTGRVAPDSGQPLAPAPEGSGLREPGPDR